MSNKQWGISRIVCLTGVAFLTFSNNLIANDNGFLDYRLALSKDGQTYEVWMRPTSTPKPDLSLSGQVTLKVPHAAEFKAINVSSSLKGADWIEASRTNAPEEAPNFDYVSFSFVGMQGNASESSYVWIKDKEQLVFSFENEAGCIDDVQIIRADDPFNVENNSSNTNPGNHFANVGWGSLNNNHFRKVYGDSLKCSK